MNYQKIISLVPSLTELLIDLGLKHRLIGRTRFCIHPADEVSDIPIIGGTKNPNIEKILSMQPDYILANNEENRKEDVEALIPHVHTNVTDINTIEDALMVIHDLGNDFNVSEQARALNAAIHEELERVPDCDPVTAAYFIWREPWMVVASDTYIDDVLRRWNLTNVFSHLSRYPETGLAQLRRAKPALILLSSEPYPFKEKHLQEIREYCPDADIRLVDGEWFSWYGSRMLPSFKELNAWRAGISSGNN